MRTKYGAVIVFPEGTSEQDAIGLLAAFTRKVEDETKAGVLVSGPHPFNPDHGGPVWYIP